MALDETDQQVTDDVVTTVSIAAMSLPECDRAEFIENACAGNSELLSKIKSHSDCEAKLKGFLLKPLLPDDRIDRPFNPLDIILHRFRILRLAGEGGMGVVYEAEDEKLKRRIAIKCPRSQFAGHLTPEAFKALQVTHPNVCRVFELHTADTPAGIVDFLTMELLEGETLATRLASEQRNLLQTKEGMEIARQICAGLSAIHGKGIVHRDLKPANVMLSRDTDGNIRAVIMDFGIAVGADVFSSAARGTPAYVAPELWRGRPATVRSDIYALGVMLHEMSCGQKPFADIFTVQGGQQVKHSLPLQPMATFNGLDFFNGLHLVRLYADPGTTVTVVGERDSGGGTAGAQGAISGYLVDCGAGTGPCPVP